MALRRMGRKVSGYGRTDRPVAFAALLMVTIVCLLIGFSGPSIEFRLPGPAGWIYVGVVVIAPCAGLIRLFCFDGKRKRPNKAGLKTINAARISSTKGGNTQRKQMGG